jgi:hypothetical protein
VQNIFKKHQIVQNIFKKDKYFPLATSEIRQKPTKTTLRVKNGLKSSQFLADFWRILPILLGGFLRTFTSDLADLKKTIWQRWYMVWRFVRRFGHV